MSTMPPSAIASSEPSLLRFLPGESISEGIYRVVAIQFDVALALGDAAPHELAVAVHGTRKATKRLRAMLRLVRDELSDDTYSTDNATLRLVAAELGSVRDSSVMASTLHRLELSHAAPGGTAEALLERLEGRHRLQSRRLLENDALLASIIAQLDNVKARSPRWTVLVGTDSTELPHKFSSVAAGLRRVYSRSRRAKQIVSDSPTNTLLHSWRKRAKYLRHQVEALNVLDPVGLEAIEADLERLTDLLGDDHDLAVMAARLNNDTPLTKGLSVEFILDAVGARRFRLQAEALSLGEVLFAATASEFVARVEQLWGDGETF